MSYFKIMIAMMITKFLWAKRKMILSGVLTLSVMTSNALKSPEKFFKDSTENAKKMNSQVIKLAHWGCKNIYGRKFLGVKVFTPYICKKEKKK